MTVKELFDKAENGTLTWEQFQAACGDAKFIDLNEGNYVSRQKYSDELKQRDTRITELTNTISSRDTDLATLQQTLKDAGDLDALKQASKDLTDLQKKYDKETKAYQTQLQKQAYEFAVKEFAGSKKFTSNAAKRDFTQAMIAKNLQFEDGKIIGADDFVQMYSTDNADAFVVETNDPEPRPEPKPTFVASTQGGGKKQEDPTGGFANAFHFTEIHPRNN
ncbi:MAG: phage scaffolding protein [Bacilli bacterium]|nr:phage scaffolding protein [Bacilli bacterium]